MFYKRNAYFKTLLICKPFSSQPFIKQFSRKFKIKHIYTNMTQIFEGGHNFFYIKQIYTNMKQIFVNS